MRTIAVYDASEHQTGVMSQWQLMVASAEDAVSNSRYLHPIHPLGVTFKDFCPKNYYFDVAEDCAQECQLPESLDVYQKLAFKNHIVNIAHLERS